MKRLKKLLLFLFMLFPIILFAKGGVSVNKTSLTIEKGSTAKFTITASSAAGKVTISSNNTSVAVVNKSSEWVENETISVTVTAKEIGSTSIRVDVNAATFDETVIKTTHTININVIPPKSSDNKLNDLKVDGQTLNGFSSNKTSYSISVDKKSIEITALLSDKKASVTGTGVKSLKYGNNKLSVVVKAENGSKKTYTITVNRKDDRDSNNDLSSLSISESNISFDKNKTSYKIEVDSSVNQITINATSDSSKAVVSGTGIKKLKSNENEFNVVVTAENGDKKTYTIKVIKKEKSDSNQLVSYEVKYDSESFKYCTGQISKTVNEGSSIGSLCTPVKEGYSFIGWYDSEYGGARVNSETIVSNDMVLYAHFEEISKTSSTNYTSYIIVSIISFIIGFLASQLLFNKKYKNRINY